MFVVNFPFVFCWFANMTKPLAFGDIFQFQARGVEPLNLTLVPDFS